MRSALLLCVLCSLLWHFLASRVRAACQVFFKVVGIFIFSISTFAIVYVFVILIPLLMVAGPQNDQGDVAVCLGTLRTLLARARGRAPESSGTSRNADAVTL